MEVKALTFDVFGTVVDWRSSVIHEGQRLGQTRGIAIDWAAFADAWRSGYAPSMDRVRQGELPWTCLDDLHRMTLNRLLSQFGIEKALNEADKQHLNRAWHRLAAWPDSVTGLQRLKSDFILATLSNGNVSLLVNMAKHAGLPWDCIISAELVGHYKPDPEVYRKACDLLGLAPQQVMMVAAHQDDLQAASREGLRTAFIRRPLEHGPDQVPDISVDPAFDLIAEDFHDLADQLSGH
ncbi:MAG: haloacid dehalogenase type II [Gammaproteobacteria bacterium]|nr:haloacid dehalogenase type II [Gammaproteobacteria bacterium]